MRSKNSWAQAGVRLARAQAPLAGPGTHFTHVIVTVARWIRRSLGAQQYNCWVMRFPQKHIGVNESLQFGLFLEINESSAVFVSVKKGEELPSLRHFPVLFCFVEASNFKGSARLQGFTVLHNTKILKMTNENFIRTQNAKDNTERLSPRMCARRHLQSLEEKMNFKLKCLFDTLS